MICYDLFAMCVEHLNDRGMEDCCGIRMREIGNDVLHEVVYGSCEPCMVDLRRNWNGGAIKSVQVR